MTAEQRNCETLRYTVSLMKDIHKSQRDLQKKKALEFVIDKLNAGIQRSYDRQLAKDVAV